MHKRRGGGHSGSRQPQADDEELPGVSEILFMVCMGSSLGNFEHRSNMGPRGERENAYWSL
jgi:hypothetical protein